MKIDETKSGNSYAPSACTEAFLQHSGQEIRVAELNGESDEAEFEIETPGEVNEAAAPENASSNKTLTLGPESKVDCGLGQREERFTGGIWRDHSPNWYLRQKECGRESDQRGEQWIWESGGDCPA
jgi:hypothetical protein